MEKKYIFGLLTFLGLAGTAGVSSYNSFNSSKDKDFEELIKESKKLLHDSEKWIKDSEEKIKTTSKIIKNKVKNFSGKNNLISLLHKFSDLIEDGKNTEKGKEIEKLKKKIEAENSNNHEFPEIYQEIEKNASLISEIRKRIDKLGLKVNELDSKIGSKMGRNSENFKKLKSLDLEIDNSKGLNIENLKQQISEKQKEIEKAIEKESLKEEIKIWLNLSLEIRELLVLWNILLNSYSFEE